MNKVVEILTSLSDDDLRKAIAEMNEVEKEGVLPDGVVRELGRRLSQEGGLSGFDARRVAETSIFQLAAKRWASARPALSFQDVLVARTRIGHISTMFLQAEQFGYPYFMWNQHVFKLEGDSYVDTGFTEKDVG